MTDAKKVSTHVRLTPSIRNDAIEVLGRTETLTDFIETAMVAEIERRKQRGPGPDIPGPTKLLRAKRPKPT